MKMKTKKDINFFFNKQNKPKTTTTKTTTTTIKRFIPCNQFIIHTSFKIHLLYLISLDLHKNFYKKLNIIDDNNNKRFSEIENLKIYISNGNFSAIVYKAKFGSGYKIPFIDCYKNI